MNTWVYADFLQVEKDLIDVYTEEEDRKNAAAWKFFIPHEAMRQLLETAIKALERGSPVNAKPLFVHGAYGTGKTYAAFVLKHLLEDDLDEVEQYFAKYQRIKDLWPRWRELRKKAPYLVVYRSSSDHIGNAFRLAFEIQSAVTQALEAAGYPGLTGETLHAEILERLTDTQTTFDWPKAFNKHRARFKDFGSPEEVLAELRRNGSASSMSLAEAVARVMEEERFVVLDTPAKVKDWLREVIERNALGGIVFLWDEFTDFFATPAPPVTALQELAQLAADTRFYLALITHRAPDAVLKVDEKTRHKFLERFHTVRLEMQPVTAYQLMGNTLRIKAAVQTEWEREREALWQKVEQTSGFLLLGSETKRDFYGIVPIHPYTALLLANISTQFSSSQRTLFRFLKEEKEGRFSFPAFLREYPREDWKWLTADYLWDYFFTEDNPDFTETVRELLIHYRASESRLTDEFEKRVLKVVLLLLLLSRRALGGLAETDGSSGGEEARGIMKPTRSRLKRIFAGTLVEHRLAAVAESLCDKKILQAVATGVDRANEEYTVPISVVDEEQIEERKEQILKSNPFEKLVKEGGEIGAELQKYFALTEPLLERRQKLSIVAATEFFGRRERVVPQLEPYEIGMVLVVSLEEEQVGNCRLLARQLAGAGTRVIFAVAGQAFGTPRLQEWARLKALSEYAQDLQKRENVLYYRQRAAGVLEEWIREVPKRELRMFFNGEEIPVAGRDGCEDYFNQVAEQVYKYGPEKISRLGPLYNVSAGKQAAEIGLGLVAKPANPFAQLIEQLQREGLWDETKWFLGRPEHPLSRMREGLVNLFAAGETLNLREAWEMLMGPPFGLMPSRIGITLFGFLLRDYVHGHYWSDGVNCHALSAERLAGLIDQVVKNVRGADRYVIRKVLPAEEEACKLLRELFELPEHDTQYLRSTFIALRNHLKKMGYPLWALRYFGGVNETLSLALGRVQSLMTAVDVKTMELEKEQVEELSRLLGLAAPLLRGMVRKGTFAAGMNRFLDQEEPRLLVLAKRLGLEMDSLMEKLGRLLQEDVAFWQEEKVRHRLGLLCAEYELTDGLNDLCGCSAQDLGQATRYLREQWVRGFGKLPLWLLAEAAGEETKEVLHFVRELAGGGLPENLVRWSGRTDLLRQQRDLIRQAVRNQRTALMHWVQQYLSVQISTEDAEEILARLPDLHKERREDVERVVRQYLTDLAKQRLVAEIGDVWKEVTGSDSPEIWSRQRGLPIQFVLRGLEWQRLLDIVQRPTVKTEDELRKGLQALNERREKLGALKDEHWVRSRFLELVAANYDVFLEDDGDFQALRRYLQEKLGTDSGRWDQVRTREAAKDWATDHYRSKVYARVVAKVKDMSGEQAKEFLGKLAEDPLVGVILLRS